MQQTFSRSIAAGVTDKPLEGGNLEFAPGQIVQYTILQRTTATGVVCAIWAGTEAVQEESPIQSGGTAGVTPSPLNTEPIQFVVTGGTRVRLMNRNTTAGALTVDTLVRAEVLA